MNAKILMTKTISSGFSGIPNKPYPAFLSNYNCSQSMINLFSVSLSYRARLPYFARNMVHDNWLLLLMFNFSNLQYTISTLWLLLHLNSKITYQHPIGLIDCQRRVTHHSKSEYLNHLYYLCEIQSLQSLLLQYNQMYSQ